MDIARLKKMTDQVARVEIAGLDNDRLEICGLESDGLQIAN